MTKAGISGKVKITYGRSGGRGPATTAVRRVNKSSKQKELERKRCYSQLASMSFAAREDLFSGNGDANSDAYDDHAWVDTDIIDLPPGEEGSMQSHEGGEAILNQVIASMDPKQRGDLRARKQQVQRRNEVWSRQLNDLVDAYAKWKAYGPPASGAPCSGQIAVMAFNAFTLLDFAHAADAKYINQTLLRYGYLGATPDKPALAFSIKFFEVYRQLHRVCPRLSLDAVSKALAHLHQIPRSSHLSEQLSSAYDGYLSIVHAIDARISGALSSSSTTAVVCPPCMYATDDEPKLKFSMLAAMDGNNSLKLVDSTLKAGTPRLDLRSAISGRWISADVVDQFKDEVLNSKRSSNSIANELPEASGNSSSQPQVEPEQDTAMQVDEDDGDIAWLNIAENEELQEVANVCVERWHAAGPEARKKMFTMFAVAGIFIAVCRHGHLLAICDMIRSGELMKYPLAITNRLFEQYGSDIGLGYDIMCAFVKTLQRSSLGSRAVALRLQGVVPSFHGHAHNRSCQLSWHPMYMEGVGLEDFEECERTFCRSNELASITRLATPFHRQQQINEHFHFHDQDKHASSGIFIYQNYRQAMKRINEDSLKLKTLSDTLKTSAKDYEQYVEDERTYLENLRSEPATESQSIDYYEHLTKLYRLEHEPNIAKREHDQLDQNIILKGYTRKEIARVRTLYRTTYTKWLGYNEEVCRYEEEHSIESRWMPDCEEYQKAGKLLAERRYRKALDHLERLVVQRLLELTKLGMNGLSYNLREKICKALKNRAEAIRRALDNYNSAAVLLNPPREVLTWASVMEPTTLAEFDMLRDARQDVKTLAWAQPLNREATQLYHGIERAREEVLRLNVEIQRLVTFMYDIHCDYYHAVRANIFVNPPLAHELSLRWEYLDRIHQRIYYHIVKTSNLPGFTGSLHTGKRVGRDFLHAGVRRPPWMVNRSLEAVENESEEAEEQFTYERIGDAHTMFSLIDTIMVA